MERVQNNKIFVEMLPNSKIKIVTTQFDNKKKEVSYLYDPINDTFIKNEDLSAKKKSALQNKKNELIKKIALWASVIGIATTGAAGAKYTKNRALNFDNNINDMHSLPKTDTPNVMIDVDLGHLKYEENDNYGENILKSIPDMDSLEGQELKRKAENELIKLENLEGDVNVHYDDLCDVLNLNREETMYYITYLCTSSRWANNKISPILFLADIMQESEYNPDKIGDNGLAEGLGQFHKIAVDQVNKIYRTDYTYLDRRDPQKSLEMMALYMKYCANSTNSTDAMLAMYNRGYSNAINTPEGKAYIKAVYDRLNKIN